MRPDRSVRLVQLQLGGALVRQKSVPRCGTLRILQIGPTFGQMHRFDPTWTPHGLLGVNFGQQGPNLDPLGCNGTSAQLGSNMSQFGWSWTRLGATSAHMASKWLTQAELVKTRLSLIFPTFCRHRWRFVVLSNVPRVVSPLGPTWREADAKGPKLRHFGRDLDLHAHHMASIWGTFGPTLSPAWLIGSNLDSAAASVGAQAGPTLANFADSARRAESLHFYGCFQRFFGFDAGSCKAMLLCSHWATLSLTCAQTCPCCAMLGPSWAQLGPRLEPTGPSSVQVRP